MRTCYGLDPGSEFSALVKTDGREVSESIYAPNEEILDFLRQKIPAPAMQVSITLVIEQIKSYGNIMGDDLLETVYFSGMAAEAYGGDVFRIPRASVKAHICHTSKAKDSNVSAALRDRFGGQTKAVGKKKCPGPLYSFKGKPDLYSALAVAITYLETTEEKGANLNAY